MIAPHGVILRAAALTLLFAACSGDAPSAARLGSRALSVDALAELMVLSQPLPLTADVGGELARQWQHVSAVAQHLANGDSLSVPELFHEATWLDYRGRMVEAWLRSRQAEPLAEAGLIADSVYAAGHTRLLAHVFRRVGPETRPEEKELQRRTAERLRDQIAHGGSWADANAESEDATTRENNGLLGLVRPGEMVPEFERAAFALRPGELSAVVETRFGFHILHRPRLEEVRSTFVRLLARQMAGRADSMHVDSLRRASGLRFADKAAVALRSIAADPWPHLDAMDSLATFTGGALTAQLFARYMVHLPADVRVGLNNASDTDVMAFVEPIVFDEMLLHEAAASKFELPDSTLDGLRTSYTAALQSLVRDARLQPVETDPPAIRADTAANRVNAYLEAVAARRLPLHPVPPLLAARLLADMQGGIDAAGITAAVERARRLMAAAGDTNAARR
jgi:hypothetical protein